MDIKAMAKLAGLPESELKGKTLSEQIKLISKKMNEEKENLEIEQGKVYISNFEKLLPKLKETLATPVEIYVKKIGQKKTPTPVPIIGYNSSKKEFIAYFNDKLYSIEDGDLIKSLDELMNSISSKKTKKNNTGTKKTKK